MRDCECVIAEGNILSADYAGFPSNVAVASIACPCIETLKLSRVFSINR